MRSILHAPARYPVGTLAIALLLAIAAAASTLRLRQDTSLASLFPSDQPAPAAMLRVLDDFPTADELLLLASTPAGQPPQPQKLLAFARQLRIDAAADPAAAKLITAIGYRSEASSRQFITSVVAPNAIFYLGDAEFAAARRRLTLPEMTRQLQQNAALLAAPGPAAAALASALLQDPLHLHDFLLGRLQSMTPMQTYQGSDAFLSADGRSLLIRIAGARPPGDLPFCSAITAAVSTLAARANTDHLLIELSGAYPIAAQSERSIRRDSIASVLGSVVSLGLLFAIAFRRPVRLFLATFAPVALGVLYGFGLFAWISRNVTPLTAVIGAMLAGVGIDYCIFYVVNFQQRRQAGEGPTAAAIGTIDNIGPALVAAWVTSVLGFVAVGFSTVRALRDFSLLGSLCLAMVLACAVWILPSLLVLISRARATQAASPLRLSPAPLLRWIDAHTRLCLTVSIGVATLAGVGVLVMGPRLELESDPTVLHPHPNPPLDAEADISRRMGIAPDSLMVYLQADSPVQLVTLAHQVSDALATDAARRAGVRSSFGLANLLPDPAVAPQRLAAVGPAYAERVLADFDTAVAASPFSPSAYGPYRAFLRTLLTPISVPTVADLAAYPELAHAALPRQATPGAPPIEAVTLISLGQRLDTTASRTAAVQALRAVLAPFPHATLTGMAVLSLDTQLTVQKNLPRLIVAALGVCVLYLLVHFRSIKLTLLAVVPTGVSLVCLLAIARLLGAKLNLVNIISVPLLVGIDIDYGIFLVSVARQCADRTELLQKIAPAASTVVLCAAATLLGFGSLAFTSVPAERSLGLAVAIGVITCAAAAIFLLLPLLLRMCDRVSLSCNCSASAVGANDEQP
jgi:predicted RND superfamily exporter protein